MLIIAISFIAMCIFKTTELSSRLMQTAVAISCFCAIFSKKTLRYVLASIALILMGISFYLSF